MVEYYSIPRDAEPVGRYATMGEEYVDRIRHSTREEIFLTQVVAEHRDDPGVAPPVYADAPERIGEGVLALRPPGLSRPAQTDTSRPELPPAPFRCTRNEVYGAQLPVSRPAGDKEANFPGIVFCLYLEPLDVIVPGPFSCS